MNLFPNTNFHSLNLDWILSQIRKAVYSVNGQTPDANGNVNLATVAGVTAVNGVGPDGQGNVQLTPADVGALPTSYQAPVQSVNQKTGYVMLTPADVGALPASYQAPVDSVNGQTGAVVLNASDVGALPDTYAAPVTSVNGQTGDVDLDAAAVNALPDTTVIPDRTSQLINDSGFLTAQQAGAVTSVNSKVGAVVLDASDVGALPSTTVVPTLTSQLVNDSGFITSAQASPVQSVNGKVGNVVLDASDVGALPDTYVPYTDSTVDGWTVRTWADGTIEAWYQSPNNIIFNCSIASGPMYTSTAGQNVISYPTNLFASAPFLQITGSSNNSRFISIKNYKVVDATSLDLVVLSTQNASMVVEFSIYARSR